MTIIKTLSDKLTKSK